VEHERNTNARQKERERKPKLASHTIYPEHSLNFSIKMNIDQETGEVISKGRSPRFTLWVAFFAFATITMGSAVSVVRFLKGNAKRQ
jgi:hypothetical protein